MWMPAPTCSRSGPCSNKGSSRRLSEVARELNVDGVLTGEVQEQESGLLSLSVELAEGTTEARIWSERYVCERADVLNVQEQIAQSVAAKIRLSGALNERIPRKRKVDRESHEAYLKGRFHFDNRLGNCVSKISRAWAECRFYPRKLQRVPQHQQSSRQGRGAR
jgi:hypothetical protein